MILTMEGPAVLFTVGLPGSGKTTWAERQVESDKTGLLTIVNRDHLRAMLRRPLGEDEALVTDVQLAAIRACLSRGMGVIVDDTNLNPEFLQEMQANLTRTVPGVVLSTVMDFLLTHPQVCIQRDAERPEPVGAEVIWNLYAKWRTTWPQMDAWQSRLPGTPAGNVPASVTLGGEPCAE